MWAIKHPAHGLMVSTLSDYREDAYFKLFGHMTEDFQRKFWKDAEGSRREYPKLGYRAVKVELVEVQ